MKILISGYYGFKNFGDDAVLKVLLSGLNEKLEEPEITVISNKPDETSDLYNVKSIYKYDFFEILSHILKSDIFISGGGSLLQDVTSFKSLLYYLTLIFLAVICGKKTFVYSQGIGPIKSKTGRFFTKFVLQKVDLITVRDKKSKEFLGDLNIDSHLVADPVWLIDSSEQNVQNKTIGVQLRSWKALQEKELQSLCQVLADNFSEYKVVLISLQDKQDLPVINEFYHCLKSASPAIEVEIKKELDITNCTDIISNRNYLIAMRFHANLVAIKSKVPTLAVSYDPKVENLAKESEIPFVRVENLDEDILNEKIEQLMKLNMNRQELTDYVELMENNARQSMELFIKMIK